MPIRQLAVGRGQLRVEGLAADVADELGSGGKWPWCWSELNAGSGKFCPPGEMRIGDCGLKGISKSAAGVMQ